MSDADAYILQTSTSADLSNALGSIGAKGCPRTGPHARTHLDKELWCLRRYLLSTKDDLDYPLVVESQKAQILFASVGSAFGELKLAKQLILTIRENTLSWSDRKTGSRAGRIWRSFRWWSAWAPSGGRLAGRHPKGSDYQS